MTCDGRAAYAKKRIWCGLSLLGERVLPGKEFYRVAIVRRVGVLAMHYKFDFVKIVVYLTMFRHF